MIYRGESMFTTGYLDYMMVVLSHNTIILYGSLFFTTEVIVSIVRLQVKPQLARQIKIHVPLRVKSLYCSNEYFHGMMTSI